MQLGLKAAPLDGPLLRARLTELYTHPSMKMRAQAVGKLPAMKKPLAFLDETALHGEPSLSLSLSLFYIARLAL